LRRKWEEEKRRRTRIVLMREKVLSPLIVLAIEYLAITSAEIEEH
jgi:hypothetical protein